jgi:hypothetical protein
MLAQAKFDGQPRELIDGLLQFFCRRAVGYKNPGALFHEPARSGNLSPKSAKAGHGYAFIPDFLHEWYHIGKVAVPGS